MRYGSVCSGIEAATVAWHPLGWRSAFYSEIDKFPRAVLSHHYPDVPLHGDFTTIRGDEYEPIDLLVGGTPCQSFSIAGLRGGLGDARGNLALAFLQLARRTRARWVVWENVPGVLSSDGGRDFGSILGGLAELGYGFAYRVLDAQFFGVAQRRRRVFVVGHLGSWRRAAAVLFERESLRGDSPPRRQKGQVIAGTLESRSGGAGGGPGGGTDGACAGYIQIANFLNAHANRIDGESETFVTHSPRADGFDASEDGTGRGTPLTASGVGTCGADDNQARAGHLIVTGTIGVDCYNGLITGDVAATIGTVGSGVNGASPMAMHLSPASHIPSASMVRRLTPRECERLQGFTDDYTLIPYRNGMAADGPRYIALGNSMAVPVMAWIGRRIAMVDGITKQEAA